MDILKEKLNSVTVPYKDMGNTDCYVTVTEWSNGEGYDVTIEENGQTQMVQITHGSNSALSIAVGMLDLNIEGDE